MTKEDLRDIRLRCDMTQKDFAEVMLMHEIHLNRLENGKSKIMRRHEKLAAVALREHVDNLRKEAEKLEAELDARRG